MASKPKDRRFVVLGLGSFGSALAVTLSEHECRVTGVDVSAKAVEAVQNDIYEAVVADATDRSALEQLLVNEAETVFVALGEKIERSILAALHLRDLQAREVYAKGVNEEHARILKALGVGRVVFPEVEFAQDLAIRIAFPNILERMHIDPQYSIIEIGVPPSFAGKTLQEADIGRRYGVHVIGIRDVLHQTVRVVPPGEVRLGDDQILIVIGREEDLHKLREIP